MRSRLLLPAALTALVVLSACGGSDSDSSDDATGTTDAELALEPAEEPEADGSDDPLCAAMEHTFASAFAVAAAAETGDPAAIEEAWETAVAAQLEVFDALPESAERDAAYEWAVAHTDAQREALAAAGWTAEAIEAVSAEEETIDVEFPELSAEVESRTEACG